MTETDIYHMQRCLQLALKGEFSSKPNPRVGCIIVRDGAVIAEGWHKLAGEVHAEVHALENATADVAGATLYVTLEPCSHHGRTSPCCDAIIAAGVRKVVYGMIDPNPKVAGKGIARLEQAGIEVMGPLLADDCAVLNPGFIKRMTEGLPFVRCKMAMSLDGRTAMGNGQSKWITGPEARQDVQYWRARSSAIITGVDTVLTDDPSLNARLALPGNEKSGSEKQNMVQPLRVICDSGVRTPAQAKIFTVPGKVILASAVDKPLSLPETATAELVQVCLPGAENKTDLKALLAYLAAQEECNEVLIEAGSTLAGAFIKQNLVDELLIYIAPTLMGDDGLPLFKIPGLENMEDKISLEFIDVSLVGKDCRMRSRVLKSH